MSDIVPKTGVDDHRRGGRRSLPMWLKVIGGLLAAIAVTMVGWALLSGGTILGDAHARNTHDLDVAAHGLETWPDSLRTLARAQFIAGNVEPADGRQRTDGWTHRVKLNHPTLGKYQIVYAVRENEAACKTLRDGIERRERMRLPFIASNRSGEGPQLKIIDRIPLGDLYRADHADKVELPKDRIVLDGIDGGSWAAGSSLCYGTVVPIDRLLAIGSSRTNFVAYLIVDGDGRVVRQIGAPQIPVDFIDQLKPQDTAFSTAFAAAVPTSRATMAARKPSRLADALEPVPLTVARQSYMGYVRPFHLPPGVPGCAPVAKASGSAFEAPPTCFLVGLVPRETLRRSALAIAPLPGTAFVLVLVLLLALVPTLQLLLIGPGEAVPRATAIFSIAGLVFAVGVATIATTFAADIVRERDGARRAGEAIAARMSARVAWNVSNALRSVVGQAEAKSAVLGGNTADTGVIIAKPEDARRPLVNVDGRPARLFGTLNLIGADGRNLACGAHTLRFSRSAGGRPDVGGRAYFNRITTRSYDGDVPGRPETRYVIDQVRSQTDGINKTILALTPLAGLDLGKKEASCKPVVLLATTILPDLVAPVLPSPFGYMIVDGRDPNVALPVLFHSEEQRAGAETLTAAFDGGGLAALRRWWSERPIAKGEPAGAFRARYDGATRQFAATGIDGTPWILLVAYSLDGIDRIAARTALLALGNWISWCIGATLLYWLGRRLYLLARRRSFNMGADIARMWPRERMGRPYRWLSVALLAAVGGAAILLVASWWIAPRLAVPLAAIVAGGACVGLFVALGRPAGTVGALRPDTERDYSRMLAAAALCIAVIPAITLWGDARAFVTVQHDAQVLARLNDPAGGTTKWRSDLAQLADNAGMALPPLPSDHVFYDCGTGTAAGTGCFAGVIARPHEEERIGLTDFAGMTGTLARWIGRAPPPLHTCPPAASDIPDLRTICATRAGQVGISAHAAPTLAGSGWIGVSLVALVGAALVGLLWHLLGRVLRALAGFGIPLEAISRPNLYVGDRARAPSLDIATPLPDRALIVGAPLVLREHFVHMPGAALPGRPTYTQVDLAAPGMLRLGPSDVRIVAFGLQLVLNDADRRREALQRLEACDRHVRSVPGRQMVIMSALSPLERIIDAYERDRDDMGGDQSLLKYREQLRWSLLLEHYATFSFRAVDNYNPDRRRGRAAMLLANVDTELRRSDLNVEERRQRMRIIETMLTEIRWLPAHVIESAIGVDITGRIARLAARRRSRADIFPLSDIHYQWVIVPLVIDWALRLKPASRAATVDYLRGTIIEHYQQCWSASTLAERVVLDHLAHDRFVNVERACIALSALVRRGLVVFDPTPRLMNRSFRMFVRQAERPERMREWRALQPVGAWARARLPLLVGLPVVALAMLVAAIWSGVEPTLVLPLLLAGLPALLSQVTQMFRSAAR